MPATNHPPAVPPRLEREPVEDGDDPAHAVGGILDRRPTHKTVNFVSPFEKVFREIASVLAGDSLNEDFLLNGILRSSMFQHDALTLS